MEGTVPRVAVTTSVEAAAGMAVELVAVGLRPVALPCIRMQVAEDADLARARAAAEEADLLVLTSSRPLDILWPVGAIAAAPVATLSAAGAARVGERGGRVVHAGTGVASEFTAYLSRSAEGKRVAYPHCEDADPRIIVALADVAADLVAVPVFGWIPVAPQADSVEGSVFESPLAVEGWMQSRDLVGITAAAIGPGTVAALERHGAPPDIVTRNPRLALVARSLADVLLAGR